MTYYFQTCCTKTTNSDNYFGLINTPYILNLNEIYSVITPGFRACGYVIDGPIPSNSKIYDGNNSTLTNYDDCVICIASDDSVSCSPPSPLIITAYTLSNECNVITIFPMGAACNPNDTRDPSSHGAIDGKASVTISGGTPPYKTVWWSGSNNKYGSISSAIQNLPAGSYTAITTDFWLDYTAITVCTLTDPTPPTTSTPIPTLTPTQTPTPTVTPTTTPIPRVLTSLWYSVGNDSTMVDYSITNSPTDFDAKCLWENYWVNGPLGCRDSQGQVLRSFVNLDVGVQLYTFDYNLYSTSGRLILDTVSSGPTPGYVQPNRYVISFTVGLINSITNFTDLPACVPIISDCIGTATPTPTMTQTPTPTPTPI